jgi:hypothetical protein
MYEQTQQACPSCGPFCRCASTPSEHARSTAVSTRQLLPLSWRSPHCFYAMHGYKRRPPLVSRPCQHRVHLLPLDSDTPSVPSHLTLPFSPCAGLRASPEPGAASQPKESAPSPSLSFGAVVHTGELRSSSAHLPHRELLLPTMLGRFVMRLGCSW